jgi:hypothetical protein
VTVYRCEHYACHAFGVAFENVTVHDIRGGGRAPSFLWGCVFSRVVLQGWISGLMFRWQVDLDDERYSRHFLQANLAYYQSVDWALDVSQARFSFYEVLLGVPSHLIRRDATRQFVMKREAAHVLTNETTEATGWRITASDLIESGLPDTVIVTGGTGKRVQSQLDEARALADRGLLE